MDLKDDSRKRKRRESDIGEAVSLKPHSETRYEAIHSFSDISASGNSRMHVGHNYNSTLPTIMLRGPATLTFLRSVCGGRRLTESESCNR